MEAEAQTAPLAANKLPASQRHRQTTNAARDPDNARRRRSNDELRVYGRGGIVTVSLAIASAGEEVIVQATQAVARAAVVENDDASRGTADATFGSLNWSILTADGRLRVLAIWLSGEFTDRAG